MSGVFFALALLFSIYPHNIFQAQQFKASKKVEGISYIKPTEIPSSTPTPTILYKQQIQTSTNQPTIVSQASVSQQTTNQTQAATSTTAQSTQAPTQAPSQTVNMQIADPDGKSSFTVILNSGNNLCDNLNEAKNEGKIKSVTMTWYASYNSYYVNEINGFSNNWTVTINGAQPKVGCSLIKPNSNDTIVWKFG